VDPDDHAHDHHDAADDHHRDHHDNAADHHDDAADNYDDDQHDAVDDDELHQGAVRTCPGAHPGAQHGPDDAAVLRTAGAGVSAAARLSAARVSAEPMGLVAHWEDE
jgi:zinc transport system substrate-binding protein